jgi:multidrug resistance efflux pump
MSAEFHLSPEELAQLKLPELQQKRSVGFGSRRMYVGGLLAIVAVAVLVRSFVFTTGYESTLVADLGAVRAPTAGTVGDLGVHPGDRVRDGQALGTFNVPVGLTAAMKAGSEDVGTLTASLADLDQRIAAISADEARIRSDADSYRREKTAQLTADSDSAGAELAATKAKLDYAAAQLQRTRALADRGFTTKATLDRAVQDMSDAVAQRNAAAARLRSQNVEARAAGRGLLLANGYSDVQYSTQRLSDLTLAVAQLNSERATIAARLASAKRPAGDAGRVIALPLTATVSGRVWARLAAPGEPLREGEAVYTLADCSSFFAYFLVSRATYSSLAVGKPVTFIAAADNARWSGEVVNLGASDAAGARLTAAPPVARDGDYVVGARITLPVADQQRCPVGAAGRVVL